MLFQILCLICYSVAYPHQIAHKLQARPLQLSVGLFLEKNQSWHQMLHQLFLVASLCCTVLDLGCYHLCSWNCRWSLVQRLILPWIQSCYGRCKNLALVVFLSMCTQLCHFLKYWTNTCHQNSLSFAYENAGDLSIAFQLYYPGPGAFLFARL